MRINFIIDCDRNFLAVIWALNKEDSPQEFKIEETLSDYRVDRVLRKRIKEIISSEDFMGELGKSKRLYDIYTRNIRTWREYFNKYYDNLKKAKAEYNLFFKDYDFSQLEKYADFFGGRFPKEADFYLCIGCTNGWGRHSGISDNQFISFPRYSENFIYENFLKDLPVIFHELIHLPQMKYYKKEEREFIEMVTRAFAPRGIIINEHLLDKNLPEAEMISIIKKALSENRTYFDIKSELYEIYTRHRSGGI